MLAFFYTPFATLPADLAAVAMLCFILLVCSTALVIGSRALAERFDVSTSWATLVPVLGAMEATGPLPLAATAQQFSATGETDVELFVAYLEQSNPNDPLRTGFHLLVAGHPIDLAEEKRSEPVRIHLALRLARGDEAGFLR